MDLKGSSDNGDADVAVYGGYMLVEASGDSEADYCKGEVLHHMAHDEDDALSCSYDDESDEAANDDQLIKVWECLNNGDDEDGGEKKKKSGGVNYGSSYCEDDEMQEQCHHKSCVSDDSGLDEMEKNRLFWEACLAS